MVDMDFSVVHREQVELGEMGDYKIRPTQGRNKMRLR